MRPPAAPAPATNPAPGPLPGGPPFCSPASLLGQLSNGSVVWESRSTTQLSADGSSYETHTATPQLAAVRGCRLRRFTAAAARACLAGRPMLWLGDSLTRYQFLSFIYFLVGGGPLSGLQGPMRVQHKTEKGGRGHTLPKNLCGHKDTLAPSHPVPLRAAPALRPHRSLATGQHRFGARRGSPAPPGSLSGRAGGSTIKVGLGGRREGQTGVNTGCWAVLHTGAMYRAIMATSCRDSGHA